MRRLRPSSEAEMVALFLRTELPAARFRDKLQALLERAGLPERVITDPDLDDDAENQARLRLLTQHREYGTRTGLFTASRTMSAGSGWPSPRPSSPGSGISTTTTGSSCRAAPAWRPTPPRASAPVRPRSGCPATGRWAWRRRSPAGPGSRR